MTEDVLCEVLALKKAGVNPTETKATDTRQELLLGMLMLLNKIEEFDNRENARFIIQDGQMKMCVSPKAAGYVDWRKKITVTRDTIFCHMPDDKTLVAEREGGYGLDEMGVRQLREGLLQVQGVLDLAFSRIVVSGGIVLGTIREVLIDRPLVMIGLPAISDAAYLALVLKDENSAGYVPIIQSHARLDEYNTVRRLCRETHIWGDDPLDVYCEGMITHARSIGHRVVMKRFNLPDQTL